MFIWVVVVVIALWLIIKHYSHKGDVFSPIQESSEKDTHISEERVFEIQNKFEKHIQDTFLPDAVHRKDLYKYRHLMRGWYDKLAGENRYDEKITQQLRNDWIDYMSALEDRATYNFLSFEAGTEEKQEFYREKHTIA